MITAKRRVLFFSEAVTLAHMARPLALAQSLPTDRYEIQFACPESQAHWLHGLNFLHIPSHCISNNQFLDSLARGSPPYTTEILKRYISEDLEIIDRVKPDIVVGDFRLSLTVSCPLRKVLHANICNAYWGPHCLDLTYPLPDHPAIRYLGLPLMSALFRLTAPIFLTRHAHLYNSIRRHYGLPSLGDLRQVYTHGDHILYADIPSLTPQNNLPPNYHFIGPVLWSPPVSKPGWWTEAGDNSIYITFGSSGDASLLDSILNVLSSMPYEVMVATGSRITPRYNTDNIKVADYLPGVEAAKRASLVICNGGSPTVYQALSQGKPVLGIPSNMDQFLNMRGVEKSRAGIMLRTQHVRTNKLQMALTELLENPVHGDSAKTLGHEISHYPSGTLFDNLLDEWLR